MRNYCRLMMTRVRAKELQPSPSSEESWRRRTHGGARGSDEFRDLTEADLPLSDCTGRRRGQTSPSPRPRVNQPVPLQLIAMLKLKTFREQLKRVSKQAPWCDSALLRVAVVKIKKPLSSSFVFNGRLQRWSCATPLSAACVSRNGLLWP